MGQLTVRNVDADVVAALKVRASRNGRSAEAEHRMILRQVLLEGAQPETFFDAAAAFRRRVGRAGTDTTALLREDRDRG